MKKTKRRGKYQPPAKKYKETLPNVCLVCPFSLTRHRRRCSSRETKKTKKKEYIWRVLLHCLTRSSLSLALKLSLPPSLSALSEESAGSAFLASDDQSGSRRLLKDLPDALFRLGGAFEVGDGADRVRHPLALVGLQRRLVHLL